MGLFVTVEKKKYSLHMDSNAPPKEMLDAKTQVSRMHGNEVLTAKVMIF